MINEKGIGLNDLMEMDFFKGGKLIAGKKGINELVVNVNIMVDLDIMNWVKPGELLLTTAYVFKNEPLNRVKQMIIEFKEKGLAGLCVKIYPYIQELDPSLVALADELGFPVIDLDYEVPFNDIMTPIYKLLLNRQALILDKVEAVHNETMAILLKGGTAVDIVDMLTGNLEHPTFYVDYQFDEVISPYKVDERFLKITNTYARTRQMVIGRKRTDTITVDEQSVERTFIPVLVKDEVHGHLVVYGHKRPIGNVDILSLESAASLLAIESLKKLSIKEVENKYKAEFFDDLIANDSIRREKAIERAGNYGFRPESHYSIVSIKLIGDEDQGGLIKSQRMTKVIYLLELMLMKVSQTYLVSTKEQTINLLFMWKDKVSYKKNIGTILNHVEETLSDKSLVPDFIVGVGRIYEDIINTHQSLTDALKAIELSGINQTKTIIFDELGIYKLLSHDVLRDELTEFYQASIEPLVAYDKKRDTDLVKTLEIYFEMNGNLKKMSESLFTHYNTILYRITRIKEITNKDLDDEQDRYGLQTALKIKHILELKR
ncbi:MULTISPECIES: PucR family transcriptional regulator [unclassified Fusibacter]|uniref:PucR family transcriptional regulator n=1 Tax=unclassified Fusibacter TaxID=2624464 RepID=UPI0010136AD1|nr:MULTISPECIES: PucR family transcriptional regulator [unclassified Fusibacter]MCK8059451.1 PucR family transcriptional regulator ligand-binding domain-containing protein [Fusibacter sp. A2]NPE21085.1 hypothetical protein [Fusibacter sp. A1]RXV62357.1 PucR family transcriptional regulator [Fusibacter sp. A1]